MALTNMSAAGVPQCAGGCSPSASSVSFKVLSAAGPSWAGASSESC